VYGNESCKAAASPKRVAHIPLTDVRTVGVRFEQVSWIAGRTRPRSIAVLKRETLYFASVGTGEEWAFKLPRVPYGIRICARSTLWPINMC
jgi:hypothetical protein